MILGDVDLAFTKQRTDASDDTGHVVIRENEQRLSRIHIDVELPDARETRLLSSGATPATANCCMPPASLCLWAAPSPAKPLPSASSPSHFRVLALQ